jgi:hypothetical protein
MNDAPKKIWAWDFMVSKQNEFMTGGWHNETEDIDSAKETEYTRSDIAQARIADLEDQAVGFRESIRKALMDYESGHEILDVCWKAYFPQEKTP